MMTLKLCKQVFFLILYILFFVAHNSSKKKPAHLFIIVVMNSHISRMRRGHVKIKEFNVSSVGRERKKKTIRRKRMGELMLCVQCYWKQTRIYIEKDYKYFIHIKQAGKHTNIRLHSHFICSNPYRIMRYRKK